MDHSQKMMVAERAMAELKVTGQPVKVPRICLLRSLDQIANHIDLSSP